MRISLLLIGTLIALSAQAQTSQQCLPTFDENLGVATGKRIQTLLKEKKFAAVEDELADKLRRVDAGTYEDFTLYSEVKEAASEDAALEPILAEWVAHSPKSYVAILLKASNHVNLGYKRRGGDFADKTSSEQVSAMQTEFVKAASEASAAIKLNSNTAMAHAVLIRIARAVGGLEVTKMLLVEAEKNNPKNFSAKWQAISGLSPRWGGSFDELDAFVSMVKRGSLDAAKKRRLEYAVEMEKASHFDAITKEKKKAAVHYRAASNLCSEAKTPLNRIIAIAYDLEDWPEVKKTTSQYLLLDPASGSAFQRRGWAQEKTGQLPEAVKDYDAASTLGESWAQNKLGYFYMIGNTVPKDLNRAKQLFESAVAKGNQNAKVNLEWTNKQLGSN